MTNQYFLLRATTRNNKINLSNNRDYPFMSLPSMVIDPSVVAYKDKREPKNQPSGVHVIPIVQTSAQNKPISICFSSFLLSSKVQFTFSLYFSMGASYQTTVYST